MYSCNICNKVYNYCNSYKSHYSRCHKVQNKSSNIASLQSGIRYHCSVSECNYVGSSCKEIYLHALRHFLQYKKINCPIQPCRKSFACQSSFRSHYFRKYQLLEQGERSLVLKQPNAISAEGTNIDDEPSLSSTRVESTNITEKCEENAIHNILTKLKCKFNVSEVCLDFLFRQLITLFKKDINFNIRKIREILGN